MTQLNTPYPSTAYLTGFLRSRGIAALQEDLALTLVLDLLTAPHLATIAEQARALPKRRRSESVAAFLDALPKHLAVVAPVLRFLQGDDPTLAHRIAARTFLPEGPRFAALERFDGSDSGGDPLAWAFGALGVQDRARHLATLYLNDLADVIRDVADPRFEFVRYAESLAASQSSFEPLAAALAAPETLVDATLRVATVRHGNGSSGPSPRASSRCCWPGAATPTSPRSSRSRSSCRSPGSWRATAMWGASGRGSSRSR